MSFIEKWVKVEHRDSKRDFLSKIFSTLADTLECFLQDDALISAQNCDKMHFKTDAAGPFSINPGL